MAKKKKAGPKDTLCTMAIRDGGFLDCSSLRDAPGNESLTNSAVTPGQWVTIPDKEPKDEDKPDKKKSKWKKKSAPIPGVRFLHGSKSAPWSKDRALSVLQVSNYPTDKCGSNLTDAFPGTYGFDEDAHVDMDAFKVEVIDYAVDAAVDVVKVQLEALKPVANPDGTTSYQSFAAGEADLGKCKIEVECERVAAKKVRFRSKYMRLVVDSADFDAVPGQALLVPDITDGSGGDRDKLEILDLQVRAEYKLSSCPAEGAAKCIVHEQLPIGKAGRKKRVKMVAHILRDGRDGAGVVTIADARKACLQYVRQLFAQAELSLKLVDPQVELVQPPTNMIVIENKTGRQARGAKTIKIRIDVGGIEKTLEYTTGRKDSPFKTAGKVAAAITKLYAGEAEKVKTAASRNPPVKPLKYQCSADVLVGDPRTQEIELEVLEQHDTRHVFEIAEITTTTLAEFNPSTKEPYYVGTTQERVLLKNYDSGEDRIDYFIVEELSMRSLGESFWPSKTRPFQLPKRYRPISPMVNSIIVIKSVAEPVDNYHAVIPHEIGHVLMDTGDHVSRTTDLMHWEFSSQTRLVGSHKRISDENLKFNNAKRSWCNPVSIFRSNNRGLIDGW